MCIRDSAFTIGMACWHGLPIRANYSHQRHGFCLVFIEETKNETFELLQINQSETVTGQSPMSHGRAQRGPKSLFVFFFLLRVAAPIHIIIRAKRVSNSYTPGKKSVPSVRQ